MSSPTDVRLTTLLHALADDAPRPGVDHAAAAAAAWGRPWWRRRVSWVPALALCAVIVTAVVVLGPLLAAAVRATPAGPASGPGALPSHVFAPPPWTPLVTEQPVARAAYVLGATDVRRGPFSRGRAPVVVSADGGEYRVLPWREGDHGLSLSPDGRRVAWVRGAADGADSTTRLVVLTLATGRLVVAGAPDTLAPTEAEGTAWSADGRRLLVWGYDYVSTAPDAPGGKANAYVKDATTLRTLALKEGVVGPALLVGDRAVSDSDLGGGSVRTSVVDVGAGLALSPDERLVAACRQVEMGGADPGAQLAEPSRPRLVVADLTGKVTLDQQLAEGVYAEAVGWSAEGVAVAVYGGSGQPVRPRVEVLDPATGRAVRTLTTLPADAGRDLLTVDVDPQVMAVAADVLAGGRTTRTPAPHWSWWSLEHLRWWLSAPFTVAVELGLLAGAAVVVRLAVVSRREGRDAAGGLP